MSSPLKLLMRAESIIQRDAVISALAAQGINAFAETRDISRKITDNTVDLAYEGYSALFDGFTIQVHESDFEKAKSIAEKVLETAAHAKPDKGLSEGGSMRRFYFCCLFTVMIPGVFHGLAIFHLVNGLRSGEKFNFLYGTMALGLFILTGGAVVWVLSSTDLLEALRSWAEML